METAVIVAGGKKTPDDYRALLEALRADGGRLRVIGADEGALWLLERGFSLDRAVGDFDTAGEAGLERLRAAGVPCLVLPAEKDETDTEFAYGEAKRLGARRVVLYGALGDRFDHSLSNVQLLYRIARDGLAGFVAGPAHRIYLFGPGEHRLRSRFPFVSLIPFSPEVRGVVLEGFRYALRGETLSWGMGRGVSNEPAAPEGIIRLEAGWLLVVESRDLEHGDRVTAGRAGEEAGDAAAGDGTGALAEP
ncbi:MAG: thiamine pyrophosphokinase [Hydrogenibacillus schlegelii]|uniref:Thiamine diphosphokinase n=1 Tax=Hydrogenibacillus schlegelii TaxID=1484 RepID=A0A2T5G9V8_HYDSH|nr:thiamine diphosphokinase [Hydrogenibacillus schlegelii]PTQ52964.1 MAG: thiamine pyrophosphokinase [Hydrogenibacillus schlegelii]